MSNTTRYRNSRCVPINSRTFFMNGQLVTKAEYNQKKSTWFFFDANGYVVGAKFDLDTYRDANDLESMFGD